MYAVIETGGKQYIARQGDVLFVDKIAAEAGDIVTFDRVLALSGEDVISFGEPLLDGVKVEARVLGHGKHKKIIVFKFKPKKNYRRKQGHRQPYTRVQIERIITGDTDETETEVQFEAVTEVEAVTGAEAEIQAEVKAEAGVQGEIGTEAEAAE